MNEPGLISRAEMARRASSAGPSVETDDDDPPAGSVAHEDLLDTEWLQRADADIGGDEDGVDVALTLDLNADDDADELAQILDLDVGPLLTSLLPSALASEGVDTTFELTAREPNDAGFGLGALREHLLPERALDPAGAEDAREQDAAARGDDEVGDDERFPVFEDASMVLPSTPSAEDDD